MRRPALALALAVWVLLPTLAALSACTTRRPVTDRFVLDGGRSYVLHYDRAAASARPLVVMLHPLAAGPAWAESVTGASQYADKHNFSVAYPAATDGMTTSSWNAGQCCDGNRADDVDFLTDVVRDAGRVTPVDPRRVYVWGMSNGAMMAWRAVCDRPDVFAAAGVVSGQLLSPCMTSTVVVRHLHGVADYVVPLRGGYRAWCPCTFPSALTEDTQVGEGSTIAEVGIPGLGHEWPSATNNTRHLDATDDLWTHLSQYRTRPPRDG